MPRKQTKQVRRAQLNNRIRIGVIALLVAVLIVVGLYIFNGFRIFHHNKKSSADNSFMVSPEQEAQADKVFRKYLVTLIASKSKYTAENYTPTSDNTASSVITGRTAYDIAQKSVATSLSYACTAKIDTADVKLNVTVQTENADTYVRLNSISGQAADLAAVNAKAKGIWYKSDQPDPAIQAQLDSGVFVFGSGVIASGYDAEKVADALIRGNAYDYTLSKHIGDAYTFTITTRKDNYIAVIKQAFPRLSSVDTIVGPLFSNNATELDSALTVKEDGTIVNELGLRSDACPDQAKLYLGTNAVDARPPGMLTALSINKSADSTSITPITRWKPIAEYGKN
jgi:hypothetical protein